MSGLERGALALAVLACAVAPAFAQWHDTNGQALADTAWRKSEGALHAALALAPNESAFLKEWNDKPEATQPEIKSASVVKRGATITGFVLFSGCGDEHASCDADVDFKVLKPDGSVYADAPKNRIWAGPGPKAGTVGVGRRRLRIEIEPDDPLGRYKVIAIFHDPHGGKALTLEREFDVVPAIKSSRQT